jgi:ABC-2 type transport system ATP-binding protein
MTAALETVDLGRRYLINWGLRNCTLEVPEGSIAGLVGPNGAGKSTLIRLCAGVARPTEGSARVFGLPVNPNTAAFLAKVGYLDQQRPLYRQFRVEELLRWAQSLNATWDIVNATRWLEELEIPLDWKVSLLSSGQQAQVALAVCMGKGADLLLLDEPFASLDPLARLGVTQMLLDSVAEKGTTVLLSSHIVSELEPICDYLIILSKSKVQVSATTDSLLTNHHVLVGPYGSHEFRGVHVVSSKVAGRQATLLVEGDPGPLGPDWQVLTPSLEEIVLAYLATSKKKPSVTPAAVGATIEGEHS